MTDRKTVKVGTIKQSDIKVRKKKPPPTQVQKSPKEALIKGILNVDSIYHTVFFGVHPWPEAF